MKNKNFGRTIKSKPIIGIQHEVMTNNGDREVQVEYFTLNPAKFSESQDDVEDYTLPALLDLVNLGSKLVTEPSSMDIGDGMFFKSLIQNENAKEFYEALFMASDSEVIENFVVLKGLTLMSEFPFNQEATVK